MTTAIMTPKGEVILPVEIREKYGLDDWMVMSVVDMGDGSILLKPYESELTKIAEQMQKILEENGVTLGDLLLTLDEERKKLFQEKYGGVLSRKSE